MEARPCIIVHGGAWAIPDILKEASVNGVKRAAQKGYDCLKQVKKNSLLLISIGFWGLLLILSSKGALPGGHFNDSLSFGETMF